MNLISIICPVYNSKSFLDECILSVLNQTDKAWELVLIDDGSTDGSSDICDYYSFKDSRIKVIHKQNGGQMKARIDGVLKAKGEYILFLDSDDMLEDVAVELIRKYIQNSNYPECILFNAKYLSNFDNIKPLPHVNNLTYLKNNRDIIENCFGKQMFGYLWMYCFKKTIIMDSYNENNRFLEIKYTEDGAFIYNCLTKLNRLLTVTDYLYKYRDNCDSITHNLTDKDREDRFLVFEFIYRDLFNKYINFRLSNENATKISWAFFSLLEHTDDKKIFLSRFKYGKKSTLFNKICKRVKTNNKQFRFYRFLIKMNLSHVFYRYLHK